MFSEFAGNSEIGLVEYDATALFIGMFDVLRELFAATIISLII